MKGTYWQTPTDPRLPFFGLKPAIRPAPEGLRPAGLALQAGRVGILAMDARNAWAWVDRDAMTVEHRRRLIGLWCAVVAHLYSTGRDGTRAQARLERLLRNPTALERALHGDNA